MQWLYLGFLGCLASAGVGCGQNAQLASTETEALEITSHTVITGPLGIKLEELKPLMDTALTRDCDSKSANLRKEIADALDAKRVEIQDFARSNPPAEQYIRVKMGPGTVLEPKAPMPPTRTWGERSKSWSAIHSTYLKIKDLPVGAEWAALDSSARSILADDEHRVNGVNQYLDKDSGPMLEGIMNALVGCSINEYCKFPRLTETQLEFIAGNPFYAPLLKGKSKSELKKLTKRVTSDFKRYRFRAEGTVSRARAGELRLPLVAGVFEEAAEQLASYIESVWNSPELKLKISWVRFENAPQAFRVLLDPTIGERAYVSYDKRAMQLYLDARAGALAHETGHILGFRDHYYTVWHPESCSYVIQNNQQDVMSDSVRGSVTSEEWAELDRRYVL